MNNALQKVVEYFGSEKALADKFNISQQAVSQWFDRGVPPHRVPLIIKMTNGLVSPGDLRPDIYNFDT